MRTIESPKPKTRGHTGLLRNAEAKRLTKAERVRGLPPRDILQRVREIETERLRLEMQNEELKTTQEKLDGSCSKYWNLYDFAPVGYFTFDRRGIIEEVNITGSRMLGVERRFLVRKPFSSFVHEDDRSVFLKHCQAVLQRQISLKCSIRLRAMKGHLFYAQLQSLAERDDDGNAVGCRTTVSDISERRKAEVELIRSRELLRNLAKHLEAVREQERMSIAREMHDELGQLSTALKMELCWLSDKYQDHKLLLEKAKTMGDLIDVIIQSVKKICERLRPSLLDHLGLTAAIEWHAKEFQKHTGIACDVAFRPETFDVDRDRSVAIFRIFQETLTNVIRHAEASKVKTRLEVKDGEIVLTIKDNGRGITEKEIRKPHSFGLIGIRERVLSLGGNLKIRGAAKKGTEITANIPLGSRSKRRISP